MYDTRTILAAAFTAGLLGLVSGCEQRLAQAQEEEPERGEVAAAKAVSRAVCVLMPIGESQVSGEIEFRKNGDEVRVTGEVRGLAPGKHGFHVHQYGDLTDREAGKSAGDHYNPTGKPHARPEERPRHVGDLGNIVANEEGVATIEITDPVIRLNGAHSIIGRGLVVHAGADEFTQPSGDAGGRVALGVIGIAEPE